MAAKRTKQATKGKSAKKSVAKAAKPARKADPTAKGSARSGGAKKAPAKKAGPKKAPTEKAPSKKAAIKKAPAKLAVAQNGDVKKTPPRAASKAPKLKQPSAQSQPSAKPSTRPPSVASSPAGAKKAPGARPSEANAPAPKLVIAPPAPTKSGSRGTPGRSHAPVMNRGADTITLVPAKSRPSNPGASRSGAGVTLVRRASERPAAASPPLPLPMRRYEEPLTLEQRYEAVQKRLAAPGSEDLRKKYEESLDMSWIYHDSALEGVVYTLEELRAGLAPEPVIVDSSLQPAVDEIRRHKEAIDYVRDYASKSRQPITMDVIKKIYLILHPAEGDLKTVKYRRDIPQHRLYFHEYAPPDKIAVGVRKVVDWLNEPETKKTRNGLRIAARAHYDLLRVFPFQNDSGKVSRLFMNLLLLRAGYPEAIIHSTERQRYYDALKGVANVVLQMVQEAVENSLASVEKLLDEHEARLRPQPAPASPESSTGD
jgi:hypothetical protein